MKRSKYSESQIVFAIKQAETGTRVTEVCRKMGISEVTFYNWKKKYSGLGVSELRRLKKLEEENSQLKKLVANLSLDKQILQDVLKKSFEVSSKTGDGLQHTLRVQYLHKPLLRFVAVAQKCVLLQGVGTWR